MPADPVTAIAGAVSSIADLVARYLSTREVRHMRAAIDAAERYILINERMGENKSLSDEERLKLLRKFRRRFFKFN